MTYVVPQVQVFQEFAQTAAEITDPLRACIIGPHFQLVRFSEASEKGNGVLGAYAPNTGGTYTWPNKNAGAVVDQTYTRLHIQDAYLRYLTDTGVAVTRNSIRSAAKYLVSTPGFARDTALKNRDVKIGDVVKVIGTGSNAGLELWTTVAGFVYDKSTSSASSSGAATNVPTIGAATFASTTLVGSVNLTQATAYGTGFSQQVHEAGAIRETYTIEVLTGGSLSVDFASMRFRITSATGTDNNVSMTPVTGTTQTIGTRGLQVTFSGATVAAGDKWQVVVQAVHTVTAAPTVSGADAANIFTGSSDTRYILTITTGGASGTAKFTYTTSNGTDSGGPLTITASSAVVLGKFGLKVTFGAFGGTYLAKGQVYYVDAVASANRNISTLVLANNLPENLVPTGAGGTGAGSYYYEPLSYELYIKKTMEVSRCDPSTGTTNFTQNAAGLTVAAGIYGYDAEWYDTPGTLLPLSVLAGTLYTSYRAFMPTYNGDAASVTNATTAAQLLGPAVVDNPLSLAVSKALANSNGTAVRFISVATDDLAGYTAAIDRLVGRDDVYSLVPLTFDATVLSMIKTHIDAMSTPSVGRWRTGWFGAQAVTTKQIATAVGYIGDDDAPGTNYRKLLTSNGTFSTKGVRAGDIVRTFYGSDICGNESYAEYVVESVENEQTLILVSGPTIQPPSTDIRVEVWRNLTVSEQAAELAAKATAYGTRRIRYVWPDLASLGGVQMHAYHMAAALAGLRSSVVPHQGLTNVEVAGFDNVRREYFNSTQMDTMASGGVWIVTQDPNTLSIFTRHQVTTGDTTNVKLREDSVTANFDSISYYFLRQLKPFIGRANVTPTTLAMVNTQLQAGISFLKTNSFVESLGGQLLDAQIVSIKTSETFADRIEVRMNLVLPLPLNNIELTLVV